MDRPSVAVAVLMERRRFDSGRWQVDRWEAVDVMPDPGGEPRLVLEESGRVQWLHPGLQIELFRDEAEGYYLNLESPQPFVFVMWADDEGMAAPKLATASYNEAARLLDGGAAVDGVPMPAEMAAWLAEFTQAHYKPEPKRRIRPPSFRGARRTSNDGEPQ